MDQIDEALSIFNGMAWKERKKFLEIAAPLVDKEPETKKDRLTREIASRIQALKHDWSNYPETWEQGAFQSISMEMREIWDLLDDLAYIDCEEKKEDIRQKAQAILDAGFNFSQIKIDGELYNCDGRSLSTVQPFDDTDIPF